MKKNNFFMIILFVAVALSGISFEARGMEDSSTNKAALIGAGLGAAALAAGGYYLTNTATYNTYQADKARKLEEKEKSDNPFAYAQRLTLESNEISGNEKLEAFQKQYDEQRRAEAQRYATKITKKPLPSHIIDDYAGENGK